MEPAGAVAEVGVVPEPRGRRKRHASGSPEPAESSPHSAADAPTAAQQTAQEAAAMSRSAKDRDKRAKVNAAKATQAKHARAVAAAERAAAQANESSPAEPSPLPAAAAPTAQDVASARARERRLAKQAALSPAEREANRDKVDHVLCVAVRLCGYRSSNFVFARNFYECICLLLRPE